MISRALEVEWRPRPFCHDGIPAMACDFQPAEHAQHDSKAFWPTSKPRDEAALPFQQQWTDPRARLFLQNVDDHRGSLQGADKTPGVAGREDLVRQRCKRLGLAEYNALDRIWSITDAGKQYLRGGQDALTPELLRRLPHEPLPDALARLSIPEPNTGCQIWLGSIDRYGYGRIQTESGRRSVHRLAYEIACEAIPDGLVPDHTCRVRCCINPDHMEIVTGVENMKRGESPPARNGRKTHCKRGHELSGDNLYVNKAGGRTCRACMRVSARRADEKRRKRASAAANLGGV